MYLKQTLKNNSTYALTKFCIIENVQTIYNKI